VIDTTGGFEALRLVDELHAHGYRAERAYDGRSMKSQMKQADRSGAAVACIVGSDEAAAGLVTVRSLRTAEQEAVARHDLIAHLGKLFQP
jgi:histidyl-tRNA synthetase